VAGPANGLEAQADREVAVARRPKSGQEVFQLLVERSRLGASASLRGGRGTWRSCSVFRGWVGGRSTVDSGVDVFHGFPLANRRPPRPPEAAKPNLFVPRMPIKISEI